MKNNHLNSQVPADKSSFSTGTRSDSAGARNKSGNHTGPRLGSNRRPKSKH